MSAWSRTKSASRGSVTYVGASARWYRSARPAFAQSEYTPSAAKPTTSPRLAERLIRGIHSRTRWRPAAPSNTSSGMKSDR